MTHYHKPIPLNQSLNSFWTVFAHFSYYKDQNSISAKYNNKYQLNSEPSYEQLLTKVTNLLHVYKNDNKETHTNKNCIHFKKLKHEKQSLKFNQSINVWYNHYNIT